jgi:hypothetical protein
MMDLSSITEMFGLFRSALGAVREVKDLLPAPQQKPIEETLQKAELVATAAEAKLAAELGYQLCRCTWPPQIMTRLSHGSLTGSGYQTWWCARCRTMETVASGH